jgi:hypothetical protein
MIQLHIPAESLPAFYAIAVIVVGGALWALFFPSQSTDAKPRRPARPRLLSPIAIKLGVMAIAFGVGLSGYVASDATRYVATDFEYTMWRFAMWIGVLWFAVMACLIVFDLINKPQD